VITSFFISSLGFFTFTKSIIVLIKKKDLQFKFFFLLDWTMRGKFQILLLWIAVVLVYAAPPQNGTETDDSTSGKTRNLPGFPIVGVPANPFALSLRRRLIQRRPTLHKINLISSSPEPAAKTNHGKVVMVPVVWTPKLLANPKVDAANAKQGNAEVKAGDESKAGNPDGRTPFEYEYQYEYHQEYHHEYQYYSF
jgi:hypothetical protein